MIRMLTAALAVALAAPAQAADPAAPVEAVVQRSAQGWTVDLTLDRAAPVWVFENSESVAPGRGWRLDQWRVETPGVVLSTISGRDVLLAEGGGAVPRAVRLTVSPRFVDLQSNYDPVLMFSNGAVAWYSEAFNLIPAASVEELAQLPRDLESLAEAAGRARVTWSDAAGPVLFKGVRVERPTARQADSYVLFGEARLESNGSFATISDPGMPDWIAAELGEFAPRIGEVYARRLGPGADEGAAVMMSWAGPTEGLSSMAGSVLPGLVVMAFEGEGLLQPRVGVRDGARWFIGHESAHFWLGQTVRYQSSADSWITEGGADLMAVRGLEALDPEFSGRPTLQASVDDCVRLGVAPVATSADRGEFRAHYACGGVFALVAEASQRRSTGGDWFDFLAPLIDESREDRVLTRSEWLDRLDRISGDPSIRRDIESLLDAGVADPATVVASLLDRAGVAYRIEAGRILLV